MRCCPYCNSKLKKNTKFCPECGMAVTWVENNVEISDRKVAKRTTLSIILLVLVIAIVSAFFSLGGIDFVNKIITSNEITPTETTVPAIAFSDDPAAISAASQSVVKLNCYNKNGELCATGSGFACFADNVIVTNHHVIEGGVYSIEASTENGRSFDVSYVLAADEGKDIAILGTSSSHNLTLLQPGNSGNLQKGEKVVAIGSPLGLLNSVSTGVFSGYVKENSMNVLQFTASISSGSSGGALFNDAGEVLGITFASYEAGQNLNLAIPIAQVERMWNSTSNTKMTIADFCISNFPDGMLVVHNNVGSEVAITAANLQGEWKHIFYNQFENEEILVTLIIDGNRSIYRWDYADGSYTQWEGPWQFVSSNEFQMTRTSYVDYNASTNTTKTDSWGVSALCDPVEKLYENAILTTFGEYWYRQ